MLIFKKKNAILVTTVLVVYFVAKRLHLNNVSTSRKSATFTSKTQRNFAETNTPSQKTFRKVQRKEDSVIPLSFFEAPVNVSRYDFRSMLKGLQVCQNRESAILERNIFLMVLIASAAWEFERRNIIRRTWASESNVLGKRVQFVFFLGNDGNREHNEKIQEEFKKYEDIVQEDYRETYRNLTLKTQGQLKWFTQYCTCATFFMHIDDDVVPDITGIVNYHIQLQHFSRTITCPKVFQPIVRRDGKWITSMEEYSGDRYPLSCIGWCFLMPRAVAIDLYQMSLDTPLLHLEDVAITGIIREKVGNVEVRKVEGGEGLCQHKGWPKDRPTNEKIIDAWEEIKKSHIR